MRERERESIKIRGLRCFVRASDKDKGWKGRRTGKANMSANSREIKKSLMRGQDGRERKGK